MKYCSLCLLCLLMFGCSKGSNQASSPGSPSGPPKKDPGIDAAVYAFQSIDYVEKSCVETSCAIGDINYLGGFARSAVNKVSDPELQKQLSDLESRVGDLGTEKEVQLHGKDEFDYKLDRYRRVRDEVLENIKKAAAAQNASVDFSPTEQLEVAHPPDPKWERRSQEIEGRNTTFYELRPKNAITMEDSIRGGDKLVKPKLSVICGGKDLLISVDETMQTDKVKLKYDQAPAVNETWWAGNTAIQPRNTRQFFNRLLQAKVFSIEVMPRHRSAQTLTYSLSDFKQTAGDDWDCKR